MNIVFYSDDINLLSYWESVFDSYSSVEDLNELNNLHNSLVIINYSAFETQEYEIISKLLKNANKIMVLHRVPNITKAKELLSIGVQGYGNALMKPHFLLSAVDAIKENMVWLHPEFTSALIMQIPEKRVENISEIISVLSQREKEVVLFLKEGLTYNKIAENLGITPRTVKAHAHSIYTKLQVKDRLSLALLLK